MADRQVRAERNSRPPGKGGEKTKQKIVVAAGIGAMILTTLVFVLS